MPGVSFRVRVRNPANTADLVVWTMDELSDPPSGDGTEIDVITGRVRSGSYRVRLADRLVTATERTGTRWFADAQGRNQLLSRLTYFDRALDGGAWVPQSVGYITRVALPDAATVDLQVGESSRVPVTARAFTVDTPSSARGALLGGPITADWGPVRSASGWQMRVSAVGGPLSARLVTLIPERGGVSPTFAAAAVTPPMIAQVNALAADGVAARSAPFAEEYLGVLGEVRRASLAPALRALITTPSGTNLQATPIILAFAVVQPAFGAGSSIPFTEPTLLGSGALHVEWPAGEALPAVDSRHVVRVTSSAPSPASPLYYDTHPLTIAEELYLAAGVAVDAASFAAARTEMGATLRLAIRATAPVPLQEWIESTIGGPLGVTFLPDGAGRMRVQLGRFVLSALPGTTLTLDDVAAVGSVWDLHEQSAVARVTWSQAQYLPGGDPAASDGVFVQRQVSDYVLGDQTTFAAQTVSYEIDGMYHTAGTWLADERLAGSSRLAGIAGRYQRGAARTELSLIRGRAVVDALTIGQVLQVDVPSLPIGRVRRGDSPGTTSPRVMQVLRLTEQVATRDALFEDCGPAANPFGLVPTLTLTVTVSGGQATALVTVTNAATLSAAFAVTELQLAFTGGSAPVAADWSDAALLLLPIPTDAIALPISLRDTTVWARARAGVLAETLFSAYSTPISATVAALPGVTSLAVAPVVGSGSQLAVSWSRATTDGAVLDIEARTGSEPFAAQRTTPPGALAATVTRLQPSTLYDVRVRARIAATGAVSAWSTASASTNASTAIVSPPQMVAIASDGGGTFLVEAVVGGNPLPDLEAEAALETGVGTNAYGAYVPIGVATPDASGRARVSATAPRDFLRRRLRVRGVSSVGASTYVVASPDVTPYEVQQLAPDMTRWVSAFVNVPTTFGTITINFTYTGPASTYNARVTASAGVTTLLGITSGASSGVSGRLFPGGGFNTLRAISVALDAVDSNGTVIDTRVIGSNYYIAP